MKHLVRFLACSGLLVIWALPVQGGEAQVTEDGSVKWQAGVDGVEIEWNPNGSVRRIYSRYSTPVEVADRRGITTAQVIAEEKAKGGIARFMQQSIASVRVVAEVQADINKAVQQRNTGSTPQLHKTDERTMIQSLAEVTSSAAAATLRGVIVLEKGYDDKSQEAWVVVGISEKTIGAAEGVRNMTVAPGRPDVTKGSLDSTGNQPSELRRSNQKDW